MVANKDFKMPNTCGDCPYCIHTADEKRYIGYCNTSDDDYYCKALDRFMEYDEVDGGVDILEKPSDCPLVEAISKADYETRLKADMIAMLEELKEQLREMHEDFFETEHFDEAYGVSDSMDVIQERINDLGK